MFEDLAISVSLEELSFLSSLTGAVSEMALVPLSLNLKRAEVGM